MPEEKFDLEKFKEFKNQTEIEYNKIISVICPALKAEVFFTSDGFHHLRYDRNRSERNKKAQKSKFIYLNHAVEIIRKSTTVQEYRREFLPYGKSDASGFRGVKLYEWFAFMHIISVSKCIRIKAIVERVGGEGQYHFLSVMPYWDLSNGKRFIGHKNLGNE